MNRRRFLVATGSALTTGLAGCLGASAETNDDNTVGMTMDSFRPESLTVPAGTTVTFDNTSSHTHTVTAVQNEYPEGASYWASGGFASEDEAVAAWRDNRGGAIEPGQSYEHTFERPGTYRYICIPHLRANMRGKIVVEE